MYRGLKQMENAAMLPQEDTTMNEEAHTEEDQPFELEVCEKILAHYNGLIKAETKDSQDSVVVLYNISVPFSLANEADGSVLG